jgi:hypothetical protein
METARAASRASIARAPSLPDFNLAQNDTFHGGIWRGVVDVDNATRWKNSVTSWLAATRGTRLVIGISDESPPPSPEARAVFVAALEATSAAHVQVGILILGTGFKNALLRSAVTAVSMLARNAMPMLVASSPDELFRKLPPELQKRVTFDQVIADVMK